VLTLLSGAVLLHNSGACSLTRRRQSQQKQLVARLSGNYTVILHSTK
jgi:hypothetical protein